MIFTDHFMIQYFVCMNQLNQKILECIDYERVNR